MKVIPLGLQCSVPQAIQNANLREYSYPFDWLWTPSKTTLNILRILINESMGIDSAVDYMTTGYTYYTYLGNEHYISCNNVTESQMNKTTGLGITHFIINDDYKHKLRRRLGRMLNDIKSSEPIVFIYADAAHPRLNYHLNDIEYGVDATEDLMSIYNLIYPVNNNIKIVYFCWNTRYRTNEIIEHNPFNFQNSWGAVAEIIKSYLLNMSSIAGLPYKNDTPVNQ
jgi:hypothetical protein